MKKASNQKMVLENIVQNLMRNKNLKKNRGGVFFSPPPRYLTFVKKPGNKGVKLLYTGCGMGSFITTENITEGGASGELENRSESIKYSIKFSC